MLILRAATARDVPAIRAIETESFPDPWSEKSFSEYLSLPDVPFLVADDDGIVSGYVIARFTADEFEILNVAVAPARRRLGVGETLLSRIVRDFGERLAARDLLSGKGWLEVRTDNAPAAALYRKLGFEERSVRRNYYGNGVDAVLMSLDCFVR